MNQAWGYQKHRIGNVMKYENLLIFSKHVLTVNQCLCTSVIFQNQIKLYIFQVSLRDQNVFLSRAYGQGNKHIYHGVFSSPLLFYASDLLPKLPTARSGPADLHHSLFLSPSVLCWQLKIHLLSLSNVCFFFFF